MEETNTLQHYGVKGMKWGVRRYQNKDGTLTPYGRKRLNEDYEWDASNIVSQRKKQIAKQEALKKFGLDGNVIKKGTQIHRVANEDETIGTRRKYVSVTDADQASYNEAYDMIGLDPTKDFGEYTYEAIKDLKIASEREVVDHVMEKYGDTRLKNMYKTDAKYQGLDNPFYKELHREVRATLNKYMDYHMDEINDFFKEKGYDGIFDIEDGLFAQYPVILSTPIDSIKLKSYEHLG